MEIFITNLKLFISPRRLNKKEFQYDRSLNQITIHGPPRVRERRKMDMATRCNRVLAH